MVSNGRYIYLALLNTMSIMKQFLILIAFAIFNINAKAQTNNTQGAIISLKVTNTKGHLLLTWQMSNGEKAASFEIQSSADGGLTYRTIGYVWGADPKEEEASYAFKHNNSTRFVAKQQFRILDQHNATLAITSEAPGIDK
jgi:hypothetical protein